MQMEAEFCDIYDRKLMSLYGMDGKRPNLMDMAGTESRAITKIDMINKSTSKENLYDDPTMASNNMMSRNFLADTNSRDSSEEKRRLKPSATERSINMYLDANLKEVPTERSKFNFGLSINASKDNIRQVSGKVVDRHDMPISINPKCLSHQNKGRDT